MATPNHIIVDRRDLLGGRLIQMLNGLRMSRLLGSKFLMTWYSDNSDFQKLVSDLNSLFVGELTELFNKQTGSGTLISIDDPLMLSARRDVAIEPNSAAFLDGISDALVRPIFDDDPAIPFLLSRRFSNYYLRADDNWETLRAQLSVEFNLIPKHPAVSNGISKVDQLLPAGSFAALHVRRLHLLRDTGLQLNRFDSYCSTSLCHATLEWLHERGDGRPILIASDSPALARELKRGRSDWVICSDDLIDIDGLNGIQRALLDIYFLSKATSIYGALSAFGIVASLIGVTTYRDLLKNAVAERLCGDDETGRLFYLSDSKENNSIHSRVSDLKENDSSALFMRIAERGLSHKIAASEALEIALKGIVLRWSQYGHKCFYGDWESYIDIAKRIAERADHHSVQQSLQIIELCLRSRDDTQLPVHLSAWETASEQQEASDLKATFVKLIYFILAMDCRAFHGDHAGAIGWSVLAVASAANLNIRTRGLLMRISSSYDAIGRGVEALHCVSAATAADPNYADSHFVFGEALRSAGIHALAVKEYRRAAELEPQGGRYWYALSLSLRSVGEGNEAAVALAEAATCEPENEMFRGA